MSRVPLSSLIMSLVIAFSCSNAAVADHVRDGSGIVTLQTTGMILKLDKAAHGAIVSCRRSGTGGEMIASNADQRLFLLAVSKPSDRSGKFEWLSSRNAKTRWEVTDNQVVITFTHVGGRDINAVCTADVVDRGTRWSIRVSGSESVVLEKVIYPIVDLRVDVKNDALVAGLTKGGVFHHPSRWSINSTLTADQPGRLCAQFACWYLPDGGLYTATRDARGYPKTFQVRRTDKALQLAWHRRTYHQLDTAGPFALGYSIDLRTFAGDNAGVPTDWRDAADIYKRWALKQVWCRTPYVKRKDVPEWLRSGPAMIRFNRSWLARPERIEAWLKDHWQKRFADAPLVVALWGWEHVGSWISPKYFPLYPSEQGFARVVKAIRHAGGHPFPWPSGYYWNVEYDRRPDGTFAWNDWEDFRKTGLPHALRNRDGSPLVRKLPWLLGGRNAVLCRGDAWTRHWFTNNCLELMQRGCDMIQVDQVVGGAAPGNGNCFAMSHGHRPGVGVWDTDAFRLQLQELAEKCRQVQPGFVLSIEEPQELFNHLIGIQDYRDTQVAWRPERNGQTPASVFGYLYHEFLPVFQSNPRVGDVRNLAHCIVTGQIPHCVPHWPVVPTAMLVNGDFSAWTRNVPDAWQKVSGWQGKRYTGRATRDDRQFHGAAPGLKLENSAADGVVQVSQNIPVGPSGLVPGQTYRLSAWVKVAQLAKSDSGLAIAALTRQLKSKATWKTPYGTNAEWHRSRVEFTVPHGADIVRFMIHVDGRCRLWIDDIMLERRATEGWQPARRSGLPPDFKLLRQWVELFHGRGRPYLLFGCMLHPPQLMAARGDGADMRDDVLVNAFRAPDGSEAMIVVNASWVPIHARLRWNKNNHDLDLAAQQVKLIVPQRRRPYFADVPRAR